MDEQPGAPIGLHLAPFQSGQAAIHDGHPEARVAHQAALAQNDIGPCQNVDPGTGVVADVRRLHDHLAVLQGQQPREAAVHQPAARELGPAFGLHLHAAGFALEGGPHQGCLTPPPDPEGRAGTRPDGHLLQ